MKTVSLFLVLVAGTISGFAGAGDAEEWKGLRRLVEQGHVLPLEDILARYPEAVYGQLLDIEVEREHGRIVYELEFLRDDGRVLEVEVDAGNGELLEQEID